MDKNNWNWYRKMAEMPMSDSERIHIAADSAGKRTLCGRDVHPAMSVTHRPSKATCGLCKRVRRGSYA